MLLKKEFLSTNCFCRLSNGQIASIKITTPMTNNFAVRQVKMLFWIWRFNVLLHTNPKMFQCVPVTKMKTFTFNTNEDTENTKNWKD